MLLEGSEPGKQVVKIVTFGLVGYMFQNFLLDNVLLFYHQMLAKELQPEQKRTASAQLASI